MRRYRPPPPPPEEYEHPEQEEPKKKKKKRKGPIFCPEGKWIKNARYSSNIFEQIHDKRRHSLSILLTVAELLVKLLDAGTPLQLTTFLCSFLKLAAHLLGFGLPGEFWIRSWLLCNKIPDITVINTFLCIFSGIVSQDTLSGGIPCTTQICTELLYLIEWFISDFWHCPQSRQCIHESFKCDGHNHCMDATDETNCTAGETNEEEAKFRLGESISFGKNLAGW